MKYLKIFETCLIIPWELGAPWKHDFNTVVMIRYALQRVLGFAPSNVNQVFACADCHRSFVGHRRYRSPLTRSNLWAGRRNKGWLSSSTSAQQSLTCEITDIYLVYFGLFWFILVYFGLFWFILVYFGLFKACHIFSRRFMVVHVRRCSFEAT